MLSILYSSKVLLYSYQDKERVSFLSSDLNRDGRRCMLLYFATLEGLSKTKSFRLISPAISRTPSNNTTIGIGQVVITKMVDIHRQRMTSFKGLDETPL